MFWRYLNFTNFNLFRSQKCLGHKKHFYIPFFMEGYSPNSVTNTYKATGQLLLNYSCPKWTPSLSKTSWQSLQVAENNALIIATGCHRMTNIDHLHDETKVMKVQPHCEMIADNFYWLPRNRTTLKKLTSTVLVDRRCKELVS